MPQPVSGRTIGVVVRGIGVLGLLVGFGAAVLFPYPATGQARQQRPPAATVRYDGPQDPRIRAAVQRAVDYLRSRQQGVLRGGLGEAALVLQALAKAGLTYEGMVEPSDPYLDGLIQKLRASCQGGFQPSRMKFHGHDLYEAGCVVMAFAAYDVLTRANHRAQVQFVLNHILESQKPNGMWGYDGPQHDSRSDNSITQYALLGVWEANATYGIPIDPARVEAAARWMIQTQHPSGGFIYHPQEGGPPTLSITAGAGGSLGICRDIMYRHRRRTGPAMPLRPLDELQQEREAAAAAAGYTPGLPREQLEAAVARATAWLYNNLKIPPDQWPMYFFYGLERFATLNGDEWPEKGRLLPGAVPVDWYSVVADYLIRSQERNGSWPERGTGANTEVGTAWGILFLVRSTKISVGSHAEILGGGLLLSGRGLPKNLNQILVEGGQIKPPPVGQAGRMIELLEQINIEDVDSVLKAVEEEMERKKPQLSDEELERWRKLAMNHPDPQVRAKAVEILGRSGNLDVVPWLLFALGDDDSRVVRAAREALQRISRKPFGMGPRNPTPEEWRKEVEAWYQWYTELNPDWEYEIAEE